MKYIVEHMEANLWEWVALEYKHMLDHVGKGNLYLTSLNTSPNAVALPEAITSGAVCTTKAVTELEFDLKRMVLLDPSAKEPLRPEDAEKFDYCLFGGILGDDPPKDRTKELRVLGFEGRHLGPVQMTTDTAVIVTKRILEDGIPLDKLPFVDRPEIRLRKKELVEMPFRYVVDGTDSDGKPEPLLAPGMLEHLKASNDWDLTVDL
ncbi:SAM-dependent RNA methyltransferase [Cladochytrium replicatum]|nr:SAM-dependent RNA methyltransferase [Cladochytrium replicatum]